MSKDMKFVKVKEPMEEITIVERVKAEKKRNLIDQKLLTKPPNQSMVKPKGKGKSLLKSQRGPRTQHFYHHCGIQGHTRPNCHKLQALKNSSAQRSRGPRHGKGNWTAEQSKGQEGDPRVRDVMKMIDVFTTCIQGHTKPNCHKLQALKNSSAQRSRGPRHGKGNWTAEQSKGQEGDPRVWDVMKMIDEFTTYLTSFTRGF